MTFAKKIPIPITRREMFEDFFSNALCLITEDSPENRDLFAVLEAKFLAEVKIGNDLIIEDEILAVNLACVHTTLGNYKSAYFFLEYAIKHGIDRETINNLNDFDPIRQQPRFVKLLKKLFG